MTSSTSFSSRCRAWALAALILLSGCAAERRPPAAEMQGEGRALRVAVLPVENLSGMPAPVRDIRRLLLAGLGAEGLVVLPDNVLEPFMARHRVRYTGGVDAELAQAIREETGTEAVLVTSIDYYAPGNPPKIAFTSRLVSTGSRPVILWIDDVAMTGDEAPGFLSLGVVEDPRALLEKATARLRGSLRRFRRDGGGRGAPGEVRGAGAPDPVRRRVQPKVAYRSPVFPGADRNVTAAVVPFLNDSPRKNAGEMMTLMFVRWLSSADNISVVEPGVVRQALLKMRIIMDEGLSLPQSELLFNALDIDLIVSGNVMEFQDYEGGNGVPKVDFSTRVQERKSREIAWASESRNRGDDYVFFFDVGRVYTAHDLASRMVEAIARKMAAAEPSGKAARGEEAR